MHFCSALIIFGEIRCNFGGKLWQSFARNLPNGPLNVVWLFVVPSKCLNRSLNGSSF